jgi:hypothetical protein
MEDAFPHRQTMRLGRDDGEEGATGPQKAESRHRTIKIKNRYGFDEEGAFGKGGFFSLGRLGARIGRRCEVGGRGCGVSRKK